MRKIYLFIIALLLFLPGLRAGAMADSAKSACVMNAVTGEIVFEKNADEELPMASTTKIMTLLVAIENSDADELVTITHEAVTEEGSSAYLEDGAVMKMRDLWYGLMLNSGNDAAVAIACHISGSREEFAELMNKTAAKIGAKHSSFKNPNGLDAQGHYTTAKDLAKITQFALNNESFREVVKTKLYTAVYTGADGREKTIEYINHNRLLRELDGCIGVKTGYTSEDGRCLVSAAERDGMRFIAVTLNAANDWAEHKQMHESAFSGVHMVRAVRQDDCLRHVVKDGKEVCKLVAAADFNIPASGRGEWFEVCTNIPEDVSMGLNKGEKVGELEVYCGDKLIGRVDVVSDRDTESGTTAKTKHCFWYFIITFIRNLFR